MDTDKVIEDLKCKESVLEEVSGIVFRWSHGVPDNTEDSTVLWNIFKILRDKGLLMTEGMDAATLHTRIVDVLFDNFMPEGLQNSDVTTRKLIRRALSGITDDILVLADSYYEDKSKPEHNGVQVDPLYLEQLKKDHDILNEVCALSEEWDAEGRGNSTSLAVHVYDHLKQKGYMQ